MTTFFGAGLLYLLASGMIEAAVKTLFRFYSDLRLAIAALFKKRPHKERIRSEWNVVARWLALGLSILLVKVVDITFLSLVLKELFEMDPTPLLANLDVILTGLVISRGSNFLHDFLEKQKDNAVMVRAARAKINE